MSPHHRDGRERAKTSDADVSLSKREVHPPAFWQLEWEVWQTESDRTRGSHTKKEAKRLSPVSGDINNGHPSPPGSPRARGLSLHGEGRRTRRQPLLDPPRKGAGPWGKGTRLDIHEFCHQKTWPGEGGWAGKEMHAGDFQGEGQHPKPRNSRNNTSQSGDAGGWEEPHAHFEEDKWERGPRWGEARRPRSSLRRSRWGNAGTEPQTQQATTSESQKVEGWWVITWTHSLLSRPREFIPCRWRKILKSAKGQGTGTIILCSWTGGLCGCNCLGKRPKARQAGLHQLSLKPGKATLGAQRRIWGAVGWGHS